MVTKRNFISITIIYAMVLFLFIFSVFAMDKGRNPDTNVFADSMGNVPGADSAAVIPNTPEDVRDREYYVFIGNSEDPTRSIIEQWGIYSKTPILIYDNMGEFALPTEGNLPSLVIISPYTVDMISAFSDIQSYAQQGISLLFTSLPEVEFIRDNLELQEFLGIQTVRAESIETEGIRILDNFFIGGSTEYLAADKELEDKFDINLKMPWYITGSGTKTFMVGLLDNYLKGYADKNEQFPAICWRSMVGNAAIYTVIGDYMADLTGLGILSGITYDMKDFVLYPIVNSRVLSVTDFPNLSEENFDQLDLFYNRMTSHFMMDVVWPEIISLSNNGTNKTTCYLTPGYDTTAPETYNRDDYSFYLNQISTIKSEVGLSLNYDGNIPLEERVSRDQSFFDEIDSNYHFNSVFLTSDQVDRLSVITANDTVYSNLGTFSAMYEPGDSLIGYQDGNVLRQSVTSDLRTFSTMDDLRLRAVMTALGYNNTKLDIHTAVWPESTADSWQLIYEDASNNFSRYIYRFSDFKSVTASESDGRIRNFLSIDYSYSTDVNKISLNVESATGDRTWFIYRGHGRVVDKVSGGDYVNLKNGDYLISVNGDKAEITLKNDGRTIIFG